MLRRPNKSPSTLDQTKEQLARQESELREKMEKLERMIADCWHLRYNRYNSNGMSRLEEIIAVKRAEVERLRPMAARGSPGATHTRCPRFARRVCSTIVFLRSASSTRRDKN